MLTKLLAVSSLVLSASLVASERPNIVLILCDDLGYSDVGFNGSPDIQTPQMDRLASDGTIFGSAYVVHPFCGPSRMGLISGRYPHEYGAPFNLPNAKFGLEDYNKLGLPESETTIATVLQDAGYYTGAIGKWHLGTKAQHHPNNRGFDDFYGFLGGGHNFFPDQYRAAYQRQKDAGQKYINDYLVPLEHNGKEVNETEYLTDGLSREAVRFINEASKKDQPFFLYLAYNAPHTPLEAKAEDMEQYANIKDKKRRQFAGMMAAVDRGVGQVAEALRDNGEFENTLVIFLSDNGGKLHVGGTNSPLSGEKGTTTEGGFRVPMFMHWPKHVRAGANFDYPVSALDFYPTFAALGEATIPEHKELDGLNVMPAIIEGTNPREGGMIFAMRHRSSFTDVGARQDQWKIVREGNRPWRLYDITKDISEKHDLSSQYPELLESMVSKVEQWSRTHTEPKWFHAMEARDMWNEQDMPNYDQDFEIR
ncbi:MULTISPECIES: sulfatase-like hydrolase/transferase [unclassified Lentimonas]|uniref:sulfatase-like hydrolase/transferase n=1 Tax=unclassified Lentimonas TaxID=2630993 RepID=UPI00132228D4|nr:MULTISPECIES: sulfatase-like hydrolase/transferase [unclassified Lentimonas]CAA6690686.1 Unannotated [Lentimonas sp. CC19]CAA6693384.1 Unannotated [Lentimonas sp. CC10]CAA7071850.1 Unannotated [Lentimonas sp. CC11]